MRAIRLSRMSARRGRSAEHDVVLLLAAAGRLTTEHRADTYQTLIGLVAVTGMREGEAVRLDRDDVVLEQALLTIRNSKYGKSRQIPVLEHRRGASRLRRTP
jgi:integrase